MVLYAVSALFAAYTAMASTLAPHRVWGAIAIAGYGLAAVAALVQLNRHQSAGVRARAWLVGVTWATTALLPLVIEAIQRAAGTAGRAQEEVIVIEDGGQRLIETGTPYLGRAAIAALDAPDRLLGYLPYQPAMASFGLVRAADPGAHWWSDARVWFAVATALALGTALYVLRRAGADPARLIRAAQVATVLPLCALTLATGGDDLPVLGLCLLAFAFAAARRWGWAGVALGAAAALKLFAWPVAIVLGVLALTRGRRAVLRLAAGTLGLPALTLVPALIVDASAFVENVLRFPLGHGLVVSPAQSPLPGYLIATALPDGRYVALGLLAAAGLAIGVWVIRRPPRTAAAAAVVTGVGLLAALLLLPATRFGYLLYPVAFLVWAGCLRLPTDEPRVPRQRRRPVTRPQPAPSEPAG
ncbi:glycosyltransferase 87 family protein [Luedemannella helvata]|uniref:Glycosyltransferase 87 family protein n=1 Tax=Luedemannella helvata TaxID=349315 RepID=A0ABN2KZ32_9ACTN